jgi:hypothetical protein
MKGTGNQHAQTLLPVLFYARFERLEPRIHADLEQRRQSLPSPT